MRNTKLIVLFSVITFVAVLVILNSVVFAVRSVSVYCFNATDPDFEQRVLAAANIKKGSSILFMSESKPIERIDAEVVDARTVNIERKFPNRVIINVVKLIPHSYVEHLDGYIVLDNAGKILDFTNAEGLAGYNYNGKRLIELRLEGIPQTTEVGAMFATDLPAEIEVYSRLLTAFERVDYQTFDVIALLEYIDLTEFRFERITLATRGSDQQAGTEIVLIGTANLNQKIRTAISIYIEDGDSNRTGKRITVSAGAPTIADL